MIASSRFLAVSLVACALVTGCECAAPPAKQVTVVVSVDPGAVSLHAGAKQRFTAAVSAGAGAVTWTVEEDNAGTINAEGEYTAPLTLGAYHVRATSVDDTTAFGRATVTVLPAGVAITINPATVTLVPGQTQQFAAAVAGTENPAVTWAVMPATGGTVTSSGLYTAPATVGTYTLVATSVVDTAVKATATITVAGAPRVTINPSVMTLGAGQTQQFTATITGISNQAVTWTTSGGTVTSGGLFTAPAAAGQYRVTATSDAVPSASATATVTVVPVTVVVSPATAIVELGSTQQFTSVVSGLANTQVTWSLQQGTSCGSISTAGLYTPPSSPMSCTVVATTVSGHTGTATVSVINPITVTISPATVTMKMNQTQQFTAVVSGNSNQAVNWSVRQGATGGTITAGGLYTAPTVAASTVFQIVATPQANPNRWVEATVTVLPGIGVQISPQLVTLTPAAMQTFTANVTGTSNTAVTWAVQEGAGGGNIDATGNYTAPAGSGTYHVVASSVADSNQKGFATVVVLGVPVDVTGTVTYSGTRTGNVYVVLAASDLSPGIVGTSTVLANGTATFTLRGVRQRGNLNIRAFMDTQSTGMYHLASDPFGSLGVNVGDTGLSGLNIGLQEPSWNQWTSFATPSIDRVIATDEAALIAWQPAYDFNGREECKTYRIFWSDSSGVSSSNNIGSLLVNADAPRMAVVRGLTNGQQLYFTMTCPDAMIFGGRAPEVGPVTVGVPTGGFSLSGVVNNPVLSTGSVIPPLYVVAMSRTSKAGFMARISNPASSQPWTMTGVSTGVYDVIAFRDIGGDGKLTPTDVGSYYEPVRIEVAGNAGVTPITISNANAIARVLTGHLNDSGTHSYSLFVRVLPNLKRPVKAAITVGAKIAAPYDLPLDETGGARHEVVINLSSTAPAVNDAYSMLVTYADGTTETLSATVNALLPTPMVLSPATLTSGTPTFQWSALSPAPPFAYTYGLTVYDWSYTLLGPAAPVKATREGISSTTTLLLYSDVNPTSAMLSDNFLPYWWHLRATDTYGNWSETITSFVVQ